MKAVRLCIPLVAFAFTISAHAQQPGQSGAYRGYQGFRRGFIVLEGKTNNDIPMGLVLVVDEKPNPHGWYFMGPTFEDHPVEGLWTDAGMELDGKADDYLSLAYMREHSSAKPGEPLSLYNITTLTGSLSQPSGKQSLTLQMYWLRGPLEGGRWYDFGASDADVEKNAQAFLRSIEDGNPDAAAQCVEYPLTAFVGRQSVKIRNRDEFLRLYSKIFPPDAPQRAKAALPHDMSGGVRHYSAVMVLNGQIWFSAKGAISVDLSTAQGQSNK